MTPKDYKGKEVRHEPTGKMFLVVGGQIRKKSGSLLKDESGSFYPLSECVLIEPSDTGKIDRLEFDVRKLKAAKNPQALNKYFQVIGEERFHQAWMELEKDPVECAAVAVLYCDNWQSFCVMTEAYGVSKDCSKELNQQFRQRLKEKGLDTIVANWYATREEVA